MAATLINFSRVEEEIKTQSSMKVNHVKDYFLLPIVISRETLINYSEFITSAILQESPRITCTINFKKINQLNLCGEIKFSGQSANQHYEVTLYYINSQHKIHFSETIDVNISTNVSTHFFNTSYEVLQLGFRRGDSNIFHGLQLIDNNLLIYCKIAVRNDSNTILKQETSPKFLSIYKEQLFTDFKIVCEDKEFLVHKAVLAHSSPVFRKMFEIPMKESEENLVMIGNFEPNIIEQLIHFIYSEEIQNDLPGETLKKLFLAADMYELKGLENLCLKRICERTKNISEIVDVILFAGSEFKEEMIKCLKDVHPKLL
ncbi:BTB/POZ and MATH domain-containing protein 2-like [Leptopilina heterotoma]|uniref:BTB/POZ and MATH domain-containing protein 2-like n=1 Tax=Leptopilina heterotoma TaxID=63436 RepID=UPI001CA992D0|nr:BTB/POZ and MATH domain-containing protein 2-like [Leptopilina heterotoma]XP_043472644.1 BTB/POZ and MATH domain-containing protein 2-like [Leptopilina heterotoma]